MLREESKEEAIGLEIEKGREESLNIARFLFIPHSIKISGSGASPRVDIIHRCPRTRLRFRFTAGERIRAYITARSATCR
jgi:hypothetical protein